MGAHIGHLRSKQLINQHKHLCRVEPIPCLYRCLARERFGKVVPRIHRFGVFVVSEFIEHVLQDLRFASHSDICRDSFNDDGVLSKELEVKSKFLQMRNEILCKGVVAGGQLNRLGK